MNEATCGGRRFACPRRALHSRWARRWPNGGSIVITRRILVTHLRKAMLEELQRLNLSPITTRIYLRAVEEFAQYFNTPPDRLRPEHIRQYQAHLFTDRKLDAISVGQQLTALRSFISKRSNVPGWLRTCAP